MNRPSGILKRSSALRLPKNFDYCLLDTGNFRKLEQLGPHRVIRPAPQAIWPNRLAEKEWQEAEAEYRYFKEKQSGGEWTFHAGLPSMGWTIRFAELEFKINPTGFGHIGLFPEQASNWLWIQDRIRQGRNVNVLNIFGYTGAGTLAAASAGARVTHVDASRPSVTWARRNLELSGLDDRPVRWIVDDVLKFLKRERRRGTRYDGIIMDPPTFGRGAKKEVWKIEKNLPELMTLCRSVLSAKPRFLLISTHTPGFSALTLENMLLTYLVEPGSGTLESDEMYIHDTASGLNLPSGFYSRWKRKNQGGK
ncbi:MAG: class I SAM-dependent methyltransferase [Nitrospinales bacterium]